MVREPDSHIPQQRSRGDIRQSKRIPDEELLVLVVAKPLRERFQPAIDLPLLSRDPLLASLVGSPLLLEEQEHHSVADAVCHHPVSLGDAR